MPMLRHQAPKWWLPPDEVVDAANAYDQRNHTRATEAEGRLRHLERDYEDRRGAQSFHDALQEVRRNRFVLARVLVATPHRGRPTGEAPPRAEWRLEASLWVRRPERSDSQSFWDTAEVMQRALAKDWARAGKERGLFSYIRHRNSGDNESDEGEGEGGGGGEGCGRGRR